MTPSRACPTSPGSPRYLDWDGIRLARIDEGDGDPVVLFHGEPTWSFLYRKMIPPLLEAGHRCIAPDYPGFGRSDKPVDFDWYTYDRHTEAMITLLEELEISDATFVVQDWGGQIGMRVAAERPQLCGRIVVMDTGFFTGHQPMTDAWKKFRDFVERTEDLPIPMLVGGACHVPPDDDVLAAYGAPFPEARAKAGRARLPADAADEPRRAGGRGRAADARGDGGVRPAGAAAVGRARPDHPALHRRAARRAGRLAASRRSSPAPPTSCRRTQGERIGRRIAEWLASRAAAPPREPKRARKGAASRPPLLRIASQRSDST